MMHTALALAKRGLAIFPCLPKDKKPACAHGCRDATKDPDVIQRWWRHEPNYNIGVATGQLSGIFVVDIDGLEAEVELRRLKSELGELPVTVAAITARGRHLLFQMARPAIAQFRQQDCPWCRYPRGRRFRR